MKKLLLVSVLAIAALFATESFAAPKIAVLDTIGVLNGTNAAERARKDIQAKNDVIEEERKALETELTAKNKALIDSADTLSKEKLAEEQQKLRQEIREANAKVGQKQQALAAEAKKYNDEILVAIKKVTDEMAEKEGYDLVVPKNVTIFNKDALDISKEVLKKVNKALDDK